MRKRLVTHRILSAAAAEHLAWCGIEDDADLVARLHVAKLVLAQVGCDPGATGVDEGHCRRARRHVLADREPQVRHHAEGRRRQRREAAVELSLLELQPGNLHLGVGRCTAAAGGDHRALQFRLGLRQLRVSVALRGARIVGLHLRHKAAPDELQRARGVGLDVLAL